MNSTLLWLISFLLIAPTLGNSPLLQDDSNLQNQKRQYRYSYSYSYRVFGNRFTRLPNGWTKPKPTAPFIAVSQAGTVDPNYTIGGSDVFPEYTIDTDHPVVVKPTTVRSTSLPPAVSHDENLDPEYTIGFGHPNVVKPTSRSSKLGSKADVFPEFTFSTDDKGRIVVGAIPYSEVDTAYTISGDHSNGNIDTTFIETDYVIGDDHPNVIKPTTLPSGVSQDSEIDTAYNIDGGHSNAKTTKPEADTSNPDAFPEFTTSTDDQGRIGVGAIPYSETDSQAPELASSSASASVEPTATTGEFKATSSAQQTSADASPSSTLNFWESKLQSASNENTSVVDGVHEPPQIPASSHAKMMKVKRV